MIFQLILTIFSHLTSDHGQGECALGPLFCLALKLVTGVFGPRATGACPWRIPNSFRQKAVLTGRLVSALSCLTWAKTLEKRKNSVF